MTTLNEGERDLEGSQVQGGLFWALQFGGRRGRGKSKTPIHFQPPRSLNRGGYATNLHKRNYRVVHSIIDGPTDPN